MRIDDKTDTSPIPDSVRKQLGVEPAAYEVQFESGAYENAIYSITRFSTNSTALVSPLETLLAQSPFFLPLWFSFEGSRALKGDHFENFPILVSDPQSHERYFFGVHLLRNSDKGGSIEKAEWRLNASTLTFDRIVNLTGGRPIVSQEEADRLNGAINRTKEKADNLLQSEYIVYEFVKVEAAYYPKMTEIHMFPTAKSVSQKEPTQVFRIVVDEARRSPKRASFLPELKVSGVPVRDLRFANRSRDGAIPGLDYRLPSTSWISATDDAFFAQRLKSRPLQTRVVRATPSEL
jgi:hypothetical protein